MGKGPIWTRLLGRGKRWEYWLAIAAFCLAPTLVIAIAPRAVQLAIWLPFLPWLWVTVRRLHDFGASAWWVLFIPAFDVACIPGLALIRLALHQRAGPGPMLDAQSAFILATTAAYVLIVGVIPGTKGPNRFGGAKKVIDMEVFD